MDSRENDGAHERVNKFHNDTSTSMDWCQVFTLLGNDILIRMQLDLKLDKLSISFSFLTGCCPSEHKVISFFLRKFTQPSHARFCSPFEEEV